MKNSLASLGNDVQMISVDIDQSENAGQLKQFADRNGFAWRFAVAPKEMIAAFRQSFGVEFLNPPSEPMFIVDPRGAPRALPFGHREADTLRSFVAKYRSP